MLIPYEECKTVWLNCPHKLNQLTAMARITAKTGYEVKSHRNQLNAHFRRFKEEHYKRSDYNK